MEKSRILKTTFIREMRLQGEHITHLHTSDIVTFETDITDT